MIVLWLLAAHLLGDFVLQTRWQAERKFGWKLEAVLYRGRHVGVYALAFVPVAAVYAPRPLYACGFIGWLGILHFLTDAQRFRSTLGDWLAWEYVLTDEQRTVEQRRECLHPKLVRPLGELPSQSWTPLPICIDQTLHVLQLAVLASLFLS